MRLASGLAASALSLSAAMLACSSFTAGEAPDAGAGDGASAGDAGGVLIVTGQTGATEIVADETQVIWNLPGDDGGVRSAPITANAPPRLLAAAEAARSLQLTGDVVYFANAEAVYYAMTDGSMAEGGARPITPQGDPSPLLTSASFFANDVVFAKTGDTHLFWCTGGACNASAPLQHDMLGTIVSLVPDPDPAASAILWVATTSFVRAQDSSKQFDDGQSFALASDAGDASAIKTFALDDLSIFYATTTSGDINAWSKTMVGPPRLVTSLPPSSNGIPAAPWALVVDGTNLYVAVLNEGTVVKVDKNAGGTPITVASGLIEPRALALTSDKVLVLANGEIRAFDK